MAIIMVDNDQAHLRVLKKALNDGWDAFATSMGRTVRPQIIDVESCSDSAEDLDTKFRNLNIDLNEGPTLILMDLFLTSKEETDTGNQKPFAEYSGYRVAEGIYNLYNNAENNNLSIVIMSKFFKDIDSTNGSRFGRLVLKPFYREMNEPVLREGHKLPTNIYCSMNYDMPSQLDTRDVVQAFCNIIFYKYDKLIEEGQRHEIQ